MNDLTLSLDDAVARFVAPGLHVHFAATPSRSNASVRAVCRRFRGSAPGFVVSTTGFHATMHLFARLGLAARLIGCFFGDNYPRPRPNDVYERAAHAGVDLEHWSLLAFVTALRAGALGQAWGVTRSLAGSTLGAELEARGRFLTTRAPTGEDIGLVAAMRPDVVFLHAPAADKEGRVLLAPPFGEGMWAALAAKRGVIVTVERLVSTAVTRAEAGSVALPPERVLAVCHAPRGAHPQPLFSSPRFGVASYADDLEACAAMRALGAISEASSRLTDAMLQSDEAYVAQLTRGASEAHVARRDATTSMEMERLVVLAARSIARAIRERGHRAVLAGIGHAFLATRLAKLQLDDEGVPVSVVVETGLGDLDAGPSTGDFLLGARAVLASKRLTSIEDTLGAIVCGADNRCLGVLSAAEVDARGDLNTTRLASGRLLVGSGGANDIASCADEVVVLASSAEQLVDRVAYITSPGARVTRIITPDAVLAREGAQHPWRVEEAWSDARAVAERCPFSLDVATARTAPLPSAREAKRFNAITQRESSDIHHARAHA